MLASSILRRVASASKPLMTAAAASKRTFSWTPALSVAKVQQPAPTFKAKAVVDGDFKDVSLVDYLGKYVVLFFYPLDFTLVCPTEVIGFSDAVQQFNELDCQVLGVSVDSHFVHKQFIETPRKEGGLGGCNFPLVSDLNHRISEDYGVLVEGAGLSLRGLFIIGPDGTLRQSTINDLPVGRSVDETLRLVKAFQFTDKHGEVCPVNWQPNSPTINPANKLEYFNKVN